MQRLRAALCALVCLWAGHAGAATMYVASHTVDMFFGPGGINASGTVVGTAIWRGPGMVLGGVQVGVPGTYAEGSAYSIANSGHVTGSTAYPVSYSDETVAFLTTPAGSIAYIPHLPGKSQSYGSAVNNLGHVVGSSGNAGFLYKDGQTTALPLPVGAVRFAPTDINDAGLIAGTLTLADNTTRAVVFQDANMIDLGTLGGARSSAHGVNQDGVVVGTSIDASGKTVMFSWKNGVMQNLGSFEGGATGAADISDAGRVIGGAAKAGESPRAFFWDAGSFYDLAASTDFSGISPEWHIPSMSIVAINSRNEILVRMQPGVTADYYAGVVLTPVPEPATALLALVGLLAVQRRMRRHATGT